MANMLFANNANTTLASSLTNVATTMSVTFASAFPSPAGSQYFYCTRADAATQTTIEIVKVTAIQTNLDKQIATLANLPIITPNLPWSS